MQEGWSNKGLGKYDYTCDRIRQKDSGSKYLSFGNETLWARIKGTWFAFANEEAEELSVENIRL